MKTTPHTLQSSVLLAILTFCMLNVAIAELKPGLNAPPDGRGTPISGVVIDSSLRTDVRLTSFTVSGTIKSIDVQLLCKQSDPVTALPSSFASNDLVLMKSNIVKDENYISMLNLHDLSCEELLKTKKGLGNPLAHNSHAGMIACLTDTESMNIFEGSAGVLAVCDLKTHKWVEVSSALQTNIAWDNKRNVLYYNTIPGLNLRAGFWDRAKQLSQVKNAQLQIMAYDIALKTHEFVAYGHSPVISNRQSELWFSNINDDLFIYSKDDMTSKPVTVSKHFTRLISALDDDWNVAWAAPASSSPPMTKNNSPLVGPKPMLSIRLFQCSTGKSVILIPEMDPRNSVTVKWN